MYKIHIRILHDFIYLRLRIFIIYVIINVIIYVIIYEYNYL